MLWSAKDAPQIVRDTLRRKGLEADRVRAELPDKWAKNKQTVVIVDSDGIMQSSHGHTIELVKISVRAKDMPSARRLMAEIDGLMLTPLAVGWHLAVRPATGMIVLNDSKIGGAVASATYRMTFNRGK